MSENEESAQRWPDGEQAARWQAAVEREARWVAENYGETVETRVDVRGAALWVRVGIERIKVIQGSTTLMTEAELHEFVSRSASITFAPADDFIKQAMKSMREAAERPVPAADAVAWPAHTPDDIRTFFASGGDAIDRVLTSGLRELGHRLLVFSDRSYRFLDVEWFELPAFLDLHKVPEEVRPELAVRIDQLCRCVIAIMLQLNGNRFGQEGESTGEEGVKISYATHGPYIRESVTSDSYEQVTQEDAVNLFREWQLESYGEDLPPAIEGELAGSLGLAFARSIAVYRLPDLGDEARLEWSTYRNYLEFVAIDVVGLEVMVLVASDD